MTTWPTAHDSGPLLFGADGALVLIRISVEPKALEDLLDALTRLDFPVNPELFHRAGSVEVEFPAYSGHVPEIERLLGKYGFGEGCIVVERPLAAHAG